MAKGTAMRTSSVLCKIKLLKYEAISAQLKGESNGCSRTRAGAMVAFLKVTGKHLPLESRSLTDSVASLQCEPGR